MGLSAVLARKTVMEEVVPENHVDEYHQLEEQSNRWA